MTTSVGTIPVKLGFTPDAAAVPDPDHPGLLRAGPRSAGPYGRESVEFHQCPATDLSQDHSVAPDLFELGFDTVDLSPLHELQQLLAEWPRPATSPTTMHPQSAPP